MSIKNKLIIDGHFAVMSFKSITFIYFPVNLWHFQIAKRTPNGLKEPKLHRYDKSTNNTKDQDLTRKLKCLKTIKWYNRNFKSMSQQIK